MRIDKVVFTTDENPMFYDFWEPISKHYKEKFNIHPVLVYFGSDEGFSNLTTEYGDKVHYPIVEGVPVYLHTLWGRFYHVKTEPETTWLIGDIDLAPLDRTFYDLEETYQGAYVHLNANGYGKWNWEQLPAYNHVAKGRVFEEYLEIEDSWEESIQNIFNARVGIGFNDNGNEKKIGTSNKFAHDKPYFCGEEIYTSRKLKNKPIITPRRWSLSRRIDRKRWSYDDDLVREGYYVDSHLLRPYKAHKLAVDKLLSLV